MRRKWTYRGFTLIELMIVIAIIAILTSILVPNFVRARSEGRLSGCHSNLHNLATAIESYAADNGTRYPTTLSLLTPDFLSIVPTCPSAGSAQPYTAGYSSSSDPDVYTLVCSGSYHGELNLKENYPQYLSAQGLVDK